MADQSHPVPHLQSFIDEWGIESFDGRVRKRLASTIAELRAFHDAVLPELDAIVTYCSGFALDDLPDAARALSYTALALCEIDTAVTMWGSPIEPDAVSADRIISKTSFNDAWSPGSVVAPSWQDAGR